MKILKVNYILSRLIFFARQFIYPRLSQFIQTHPKLEISISISERIPNFEHEQADLAVGFLLAAPDNTIRRRMATTRYVMCASPSYFKQYGKPKVLSDLLKHCYIGHNARDEISNTHLKSGHTLKLKPTLVLNNVDSMIECAKSGIGIVQLPLYLLEALLQSGELIEVLSPYQATNTPVYYYYQKFRYVQPKIRCFIDFFLPKLV